MRQGSPKGGPFAFCGHSLVALWAAMADTIHSGQTMTNIYDALIIGGGHNGLTCSAYLARGGMLFTKALVNQTFPAMVWRSSHFLVMASFLSQMAAI
jgi:hypothetical protein